MRLRALNSHPPSALSVSGKYQFTSETHNGFLFIFIMLILHVGAHRRTGDGEIFRVSRVIKHPSFSMNHLRHDVAVLKLSQPATLGRKINTICLPSHGSRVPQGAKCYVTGKLYIPLRVPVDFPRGQYPLRIPLGT